MPGGGFPAIVGPMSGAITTAWVDGRSVVTRALATSPLRLVLNQNRAPSAWVVTSTLGGGLVDGDRIALEARALGGSALALLTQGTTKVYRGESAQRTVGHVEDGALLAILPDPVACFAGARFEQETRVALDEGGSALVLDAFTSGRAAHGEVWAMRSLRSRVVLERGGRPLAWDATRLDDEEGPIAARVGSCGAFGALFAVGPRVAEVRDAILASRAGRAGGVVVAPSPLGDDGAILRLAAPSAEAFARAARAALGNLHEILGDDPLSRRA